jgi:carboxyl-terminal processing protease
MKFNSGFSKLSLAAASLILIFGSFFLGTYVGLQSHASVPTAENVVNKDVGKPDSVDFSIFWKAWSVLDDKYVPTHGIATSTLASTTASTSIGVSDRDRVYGAIQGMTAALGDPYTVFFPPKESKDFQEQITGNFGGVGMEVGSKDGILTVVSALKGTPAEKAGVKSGDKILKIDSTITSDLSVDQAVNLIRGKKGTTVSITFVRGQNKPFELKIVRDTINIPTIETEKRANGVFIIRLFSFTADSPNLFRSALRTFLLSKSDKLILDLRGNPGGYLDAAVDIASWFLPNGAVVVRENYGNGKPEDISMSKGYDIFNNKLKFVILIDGGSASASEILAGALQEHGKAKLLGTKSFGKGSVQELVNITPDTALKVTVARWLTPNGVSISAGGLTPDVVVPITEDDIKNKKDPQLDKAIELITQNQ